MAWARVCTSQKEVNRIDNGRFARGLTVRRIKGQHRRQPQTASHRWPDSLAAPRSKPLAAENRPAGRLVVCFQQLSLTVFPIFVDKRLSFLGGRGGVHFATTTELWCENIFRVWWLSAKPLKKKKKLRLLTGSKAMSFTRKILYIFYHIEIWHTEKIIKKIIITLLSLGMGPIYKQKTDNHSKEAEKRTLCIKK